MSTEGGMRRPVRFCFLTAMVPVETRPERQAKSRREAHDQSSPTTSEDGTRRLLSHEGLYRYTRLPVYRYSTRSVQYSTGTVRTVRFRYCTGTVVGRGERSTPGLRLFLRLLSRQRFRPSRGRCGCVVEFGWMVVRFVRVIRAVPACARVSRVSRVCPGSPRCLFTGTLSLPVKSI